MYYSHIAVYLIYTQCLHVSGESKIEAEVLASPPIPLGDYEVINSRSNRLDKGGFGTVFIGKDTRTDDPVAVKIVEINDKNTKYLDRENRILKGCRHKNIIDVFDIQITKTAMYIVMEYCSAGNLNQYVEKNSLTYERCVSFMEDMTAAVNFLHKKKKVYHRDIKPDNVLISDTTVAKLADFGLAKEFSVSSSFAPGSVCGTKYWMPPEMTQENIKYNFAVDIFPLGLLFLAMVTLLPKRGNLQAITGEYPDT